VSIPISSRRFRRHRKTLLVRIGDGTTEQLNLNPLAESLNAQLSLQLPPALSTWCTSGCGDFQASTIRSRLNAAQISSALTCRQPPRHAPNWRSALVAPVLQVPYRGRR